MAKINLNTFPRRTQLDGNRYDPVRLVAWDDGTIRLYGTVGGRVAVLHEGTGTWERRGANVSVSLEDGTEYDCERRGGCGCGHVLKRWPYEGLPA